MSSTRKGNNKKKGQKHQNSTSFKNNLHDTSKTTKLINELQVGGVCERCRGIIEWRRKFKKYKPLTAPKKCVRCEQKTVKHAYHTICVNCAVKCGVCEKCGVKSDDIIRSKPSTADQAAADSQLQAELKLLTERQRRRFFRGLEQETLTNNSSEGVVLEDNSGEEDELEDIDGGIEENELGCVNSESSVTQT